jgi:hypothetical protein
MQYEKGLVSLLTYFLNIYFPLVSQLSLWYNPIIDVMIFIFPYFVAYILLLFMLEISLRYGSFPLINKGNAKNDKNAAS